MAWSTTSISLLARFVTSTVRKKDARYDATKSENELRHYDNLIPMCHAHHKRVDTREDIYPADTLRAMKAKHEATYEQGHFDVDESVLAQAALQIVQEDWEPYLDTYTRLFQTLSPADQIDLYREQEDWRLKRRAYAESQVESHGGSLARLEYSEAFSEFTKKRIDELSARIKVA